MARAARRLIASGAPGVWLVPIVIVLVSSGCAVLSDAATRIVRVDFRPDQVRVSTAAFFPSRVAVRPGDTVEFRPDWAGEPHTVSFGSLVERALEDGELPATLRPFPDGWGRADQDVRQSAARECYEEPPADASEACTQPEHRPPFRLLPGREGQPAFTGREAYYSSGLLRGTGAYRMEIAGGAEPGEYRYLCAVHGPSMWGTIEVLPEGSSLSSQSELDRRAAREAEAVTIAPVANDGDGATVNAGSERGPVQVLAFEPERLRVAASTQVEWRVSGAHTVSFVPPPDAVPVVLESRDGTVSLNEVGAMPAGAEHTGQDTIDGGTYDGHGFVSSGLARGKRFTLTFSEPGTYRYTCLVHPEMTGVVEVV